MLVTARAEYACLAMLELATKYDDPKPIRLQEIALKHDIPQRFLVQILLQMKAAGLVVTTRGAAGGYQLAKSPEEISLSDIFGALDRAEPPAERLGSTTAMSRSLQAVWKQLANARTQVLQGFTLAELMPAADSADYII